ncbi:phosphoribosylamine--glycine ligase [Candidatus Uhrbacteria bacterium RIFCSPHIGHO2_12_FULL_54_23]|uniref:Phosphoribosylamine--glycine ligase n=3 Tax=Parcubacteria group TaxID=1794811 RepID=A0A1F7UIF7_9BACT|nr:MAG: Phosphoribosylaminoimidazole-succinocarboxamide synthase [Candidatus Magasanikbacteria bacterium GW2011_GWA2_50_22]OGL77504.1 MAG: phosphoribosylamine--glycine ligase [Candidatus Uhrbacteria bacterium RIFCSPHIGHO2_12_FULL_54_23]OGL90895.1 MAG: phosphoribosylamine--glycine ligase [Candidatus Uhrbacteria bacterium RIFCSPLOWO2_02_FULL_54_37]
MKILLIGSGAREHAIGEALTRSPQGADLFVFGSSRNPGLLKLSSGYETGKTDDPSAVVSYAQRVKPDFAIVGPEAPLAAGVVDALQTIGVFSVGPTKMAAQLESSKSFTRKLLVEAGIEVYPKFKVVSDLSDLSDVSWLNGEMVVKPDGLTGGKGVKVQGDHFQTAEEGIAYAKECLDKDGSVLIEEKLIGQEFSLMSFTDGAHLLHMPSVQDNKRLLEGDRGPNTGGMGSVSDADHSLPFLTENDIHIAQETNERVIHALKKKGIEYRGIIYGNYIAVRDGIKLIEYNARLGDPEAMNVLSILESDFVEICQGIINGNLNDVKAAFSHKATVCKYVVPEGYPDKPVKDVKIDVSAVNQNKVKLYFASVDERNDGLYMTGSRAIGVVGIADTLAEAERLAEIEIQKIQGPVVHRTDIGTHALLNKRIEMLKIIRHSSIK